MAETKATHAGKAGHKTLAHLFGELLDHFVLLDQSIYINNLQATTGGDALFAAGVEDLGIFAFLRSHGEDDRLSACHHFFINVGALKLLAHTGDHACDLTEIAQDYI